MTRGKMLPVATKPRYRLLEELANGGFSQVWLALDLESKTRYVGLPIPDISELFLPYGSPYVAIKCCQGTPDARVSSEVTILRKIRSRATSAPQPGARNILILIDDFVIQEPGPPVVYHQCLVTELVIPLIDWIQELNNRFRLSRQLVDAFSFLHSQGIVHGGELTQFNTTRSIANLGRCTHHGHTCTLDPHEGNLGIAIKGLENVPEDKLLAQLGDGNSLLSILDDLQDDEDVACGQLIHEDARDVELKVYDFGKCMCHGIAATRHHVLLDPTDGLEQQPMK